MVKKYKYTKLNRSEFVRYIKMNQIKYYKFKVREKNNRMYLLYSTAGVALLVAFKDEDLKGISVYHYKNDIFKNIKKQHGERDMTPQELVFIIKLITYDSEEESI